MAILWKNDPAYLLNANNLHKSIVDVIDFSGGNYLTRKPASTNRLLIAAYTKIAINNAGTFKVFDVGASAKELVEADLDTGVFAVGTDYYVYLHDDGVDTEVYIISASSTYPSSHGCTAANTRKIGGFHYGKERVSITAADVQSAIVPNSVWDLKHRPKCTPEGMVYLGAGIWVDIYLPSVNAAIVFSPPDAWSAGIAYVVGQPCLSAGTIYRCTVGHTNHVPPDAGYWAVSALNNGAPITAGTAKSTYNSTPLTGTEGLSGYNFNELAKRSNKRLLTLSEWLQAAHGSPPGADGNNDNAWAKTTNGARNGTGQVVNAISLSNVVDCVGNVLEWVDEYLQNGIAAAGGWQDEMPGLNVGQLYEYGDDSFRQILAGGSWSSGLRAGSRCVNLGNCPWFVYSDYSSRFACGSL